MKDKLRIGIIGTRGIPNRYGGFEGFAEQVSGRLVRLGHEVTVYCPHDQQYREETLNGVHLSFQYNPESLIGTAGQFFYDLHCNLHARSQPYDVILHLGYTSDSVWSLWWSSHARHLTNMDGMEWKRSKYAPVVRSFLKRAEKRAAHRSTLLIADSMAILEYLESQYATPVRYISYGAEIPGTFDPGVCTESGIEQYAYNLMIARLEPENNIEMVVEATLQGKSPIPLLIFGNETKHGDRLKKKYRNEPMILFRKASYQAGKLNSLRYFSRYYIHGHSAGGTNPSLLEAMACECRILVHDNPFNRSVLDDNGFYFRDTLQLAGLLEQPWSPDKYRLQITNNLISVRSKHNWDLITKEYESAFYQALEY